MDEDLKAGIVIGVIICLIILSLVLPITICINKNAQREFELEKMKIQVRMYGEPVNQTNEAERKN